MIQFVCWVLFPLVLGLLSFGCGLLLERAAGLQLPEGLLLPAGLAVIVAAGELTTQSSATATLTTPAVVLLALVGLAAGRPWRTHPRVGGWPLLVAVAVYAVYLAPVFLSGEPTFTGYIKLDDTSTWLGLTDHLFAHGHDLSGLAPSTYEALVVVNRAYPVGSFLPWGIGHQLVGEDLAWVFQPYLAFLAAMVALAGWSILGPLVRSRWLRAAVVFVAAQSALLYGYSLWGGIKEMAAAWAFAITAASVAVVRDHGARLRSFLPVVLAGGAVISILGFAGAVWLTPALIAAGLGIGFWARAGTRRRALVLATISAVIAAGLIVKAVNYLDLNPELGSNIVLGNLIHPLNGLQIFGIWPAGDFRVDPPDASALTHALIVVVIIAGCLGLIAASRRKLWSVWIYVVSAVVGTLLVYSEGGPWVQGKALAIASPALLLVGLAGSAAVLEGPRRWLPWERGERTRELVAARRIAAALGCAAIAAGVLWSNVLAYHDVTLAPYGQFVELEQIGQRFAGQGPTMINEYQMYASRHFLRAMDPESPSDLRVRVIPLLNGQQVPKGGYADLDSFQIAGLLVYRTIVIRTSPVASRPPAPYQLVYNGRWYQVWQRPVTLTRPILAAIPLGTDIAPTGVPVCSQVAQLAREAGPSGLLAAVARPAPTVVAVPSPLPDGDTAVAFVITMPGRYQVWLGGSFVRRLTTYVDGRAIGSIRGVLNEAGGWTPLGTAGLGVSGHRVTLSYGGAELAPGSGGGGAAGPFFPVGPLAVSLPTGGLPVTYVATSDARSLCGKPWDWIEALGPS